MHRFRYSGLITSPAAIISTGYPRYCVTYYNVGRQAGRQVYVRREIFDELVFTPKTIGFWVSPFSRQIIIDLLNHYYTAGVIRTIIRVQV